MTALWANHLFASLPNGWGVVLDESGGWVVGYSHFAAGVCGRYHPLPWPMRAEEGCGGFRADGVLAFPGRCAFLPANGLLDNGAEPRLEPRDVTLIIRADGSHALEVG